MSTEQHGMKFVVDTTGVAKGFRDYRAAVEGIFASLDKFEAHVAKTMKGVAAASNNKTALNSFKNAMNAFGSVKIDNGTVKAIGSLSAAMKDFKAPSASQTANFRKFAAALGTMPNVASATRAAKSIDELNIAMRGFKAPPVGQAKALTAFANAMAAAAPKMRGIGDLANLTTAANNISTMATALTRLKAPTSGQVTNLGNFALALRSFNFGNLTRSGNLFSTLAAIGTFKAPSAAQTKNLQSFIHAVGTMTVPSNAGAVARYLQQIAAAARLAQGSLNGMRINLGGAAGGFQSFNRGAGQARLQMMGMQNAFSSTFQIGSALRTLLGSLTIGELGRSFFQANNDMIKFNAQMTVMSKATGFGALQMDYARDMANRYGLDVTKAAEGLAKITIAAKSSGISILQSREIFEGFSGAMTVLGTSTERQQDVFLALQQVMNKGALSAEELNQQLNEQMPGLMGIASEAAKKLGMTLEDALKKKALKSGETLMFMAKRLKEEFGPSLAAAMQSPSKQMQVLQNNITTLYQTIGSLGVNDAVSNFLGRLNEGLNPANMQNFAQGIADGLVSAINKASDAVTWLRANWETLKGPVGEALSMMGKWMVLSGSLQIGRALVTPLLTARAAMTSLSLSMAAGGAASVRTAALMASLTANTRPLLTGFAALNVGMQASIIRGNILAVTMNALKAAGNGVMSLFGGPLGVAFGAVAAGAFAAYSSHTKLTGAIESSQSIIHDTSKLLTTLGFRAAEAGNNAQSLGGQHAAAAPQISAFAGEVGNAAQKLWEMASAQRAANLQSLISKKTALQEQNEELYKHTAGGWKDRTPIKGVRDVGQRLWNGLGFGLDQVVTGGRAARDAQGRLNANQQSISRLDGYILDYAKTDLKREVNPAMRDTVRGGVAPKPVPGKDDDKDDKKKGAAAAKAMNDLQSFENSFASLMSKLVKDDPVGKIWADWSKTLTSTADLMLSKDGYLGAMKIIGDESSTAEQKTKALMDAISSGKLNKNALKGLQTAGYDPKSLVASLQTALDETRQNVLEAMDKAFQRDMKGQMKALDVLGRSDESIKLSVDFGQSFNDMRDFLSADAFRDFTPALKTYMESLRSSALDSDKAKTVTDQFAIALRASGKEANLSAAEIERLIAITRQQAQTAVEAVAVSERAKVFGATALQQRREEIGLMLLTERQQKVLALTQQAITDAKARSVPVTQEKINQFQREAAGIERVNDAMLRQKSYMENNGLRQYLGGIQSLGEAINEMDKNVLQSFEDSLVRIFETGKVSFKGIAESITNGINKYAAKGLTEKALNFIKPGASEQIANGQSPTLLGALFDKTGKTLGPDDRNARLGLELGSRSNPMYVSVLNTDGTFSIEKNPEWSPVAANDNMPGLMGGLRKLVGGATGVVGDGIEMAGKAAYSVGAPFVKTVGNGLINGTRAIGGGILDGFGASGGDANAGQRGLDVAGSEGFFDKQGVSKALTESISMGAQSAVPVISDCWGTSMTPAIEVTAKKMSSSFGSSITGLAGMFGAMLGGIIGGGQSKGSKILGALISIGSSAAMSYIGGGGITGKSTAALNGSAQSVISSNPGIFKEGGYSDAPVARASSPSPFANAPHYKEGTGNTSGGIPAVLHDNEAVIPLSRGRKVPVEMTGAMGGAPAEPSNVHVNVHNYGDGKAKVTQSSNPDGSLNIDVIIDTIEERMAGKINKGGSPVNNALERRYGMNAAQGNF